MQAIKASKTFFSIRKGLSLELLEKPSYQEMSFCLLELSMLLSSGLSLTKALEVSASQTENKRLRRALLEIKSQVEKGRNIPSAFRSVNLFPEFFVEMLKVAERGENLERILQVAGEFLGKTAEARSKVLSSLAYPAFLIIASLLAVLVVTRLVIPKISSVLQGLGKELPLITKLLLGFSELLSYLVFMLPVVALFLAFGRKLVGDKRWDFYLLKLPLVGRVLLYYGLSRFAGSLRMAISSGIPIARAIKLSLGSMGNAYLRLSLEGIEEEVAKGKPISKAVKERNLLPQNFVNLLSLGEKTGELEKSLHMLERLYEGYAERSIGFWVRFAEPMAMLVVGLLVGLVVLSVILPLSEVSTGIKR